MDEQKKQMTAPEREEETLKFWEAKRVFEKSLKKNKGKKTFVFYEGPPTANGMPGIHHVEARAFKDAVLRYKTMQGFHVPRRAGWDTHGLPVEIQVEKKLGFKTKHDIENYGIARFNTDAKRSVWEYKEEWERLTKRMGFWVDLKNPYITYETSYIESLWWIIKKIWDTKDKNGNRLLYEDFKVVPWCTRCQTGLSSHEVGLGYKKDDAVSVFVTLKLKRPIGHGEGQDREFLLVWTTTPWTLPANVAVAINPKKEYKKFRVMHGGNEIFLWSANVPPSDRGNEPEVVEQVSGEALIGATYVPLFEIAPTLILGGDIPYEVIAGDFVSTEEGTGMVHLAPAYGDEDMNAVKAKWGENYPILHTTASDGTMKAGISWLQQGGQSIWEANTDIISALSSGSTATKGMIYKELRINHEYPHCWRCDTPLLYYARKAWWVRTTAVKKELLANNETINWVPDHLQHGRFGEFLRDVRDWCFSRERYWGTPLPIWKCEKCGEIEVIGSLAELKKRAGKLPHDAAQEIDLHRPYVDEIKFDCASCSSVMRRTPEVADVWFDSGAMPFAQSHYPFNKKEKLAYPADYISEAVDQTRGWFYSMLAVATLLGRKAPYKNVISLGHVLDAKGQKMSKSKGNVVNPQEMMDKYGVDALRWYFFTINGPGEPKRFEEKDVALRSRGFVGTLWNTFVFWDTYVARIKNQEARSKSPNILDQWILAKLNRLVGHVTAGLEAYDLVGAARAIDEFTVNDFSQWYVRRSRRRLQRPENVQEKDEAALVMVEVLASLAELVAPFAPFVSEAVFQGLRKKMPGLREESVHLRPWPKSEKKKRDEAVINDVETVRQTVAKALKLRADAGIKVRQPLRELRIKNQELKGKMELLELIQDEVNVKEITFGDEMKLDLVITPELKEEGIVREFARTVQDMRRELGMKPGEKIRCQIVGDARMPAILVKWECEIKKDVNAAELKAGGKKAYKLERELELDGEKLRVGISPS